MIGAPARTVEHIRLLQSLRENDSIRSVVIDIDSPGGTVAASDYLYRSVRKLAEKKPVVAFIRGTGASGGYMVSCAATKIVALPTALVGSIGVISVRPLVYELLDRVGVRMSVTKSGRLKDMWSVFREPTKEEQEREQALLDEFYERFIRVVSDGRRLSPEQVRALATGEVFTAVRAQGDGPAGRAGRPRHGDRHGGGAGQGAASRPLREAEARPALAADVADGVGARRGGERPAGAGASPANRLPQRPLVPEL